MIYGVATDGKLVPAGEFTVKSRTRRKEVIKQFLTANDSVLAQAVALPKADVEPIPVKSSTVTVLEVG